MLRMLLQSQGKENQYHLNYHLKKPKEKILCKVYRDFLQKGFCGNIYDYVNLNLHQSALNQESTVFSPRVYTHDLCLHTLVNNCGE